MVLQGGVGIEINRTVGDVGFYRILVQDSIDVGIWCIHQAMVIPNNLSIIRTGKICQGIRIIDFCRDNQSPIIEPRSGPHCCYLASSKHPKPSSIVGHKSMKTRPPYLTRTAEVLGVYRVCRYSRDV